MQSPATASTPPVQFMDRHTAADNDSDEYQEGLAPYSSLLSTIDTSTARANHPYGLPLAVERRPWHNRIYDTLFSGAFVGLVVFGYCSVLPSSLRSLPTTAAHAGVWFGAYAMMDSMFEDRRMRNFGMQAAETQRRADSKIVARVLDTSFLNR